MSSERKTLWGILALPNVYDFYHKVIGAEYARRMLADEFIRSQPTDRILEVGCGTARMLDYLSPSRYVGIDVNAEYIADARRRYGDRGEFITGDVGTFSFDRSDRYDLVLA